MKCSQQKCGADALFRFTWPGEDEAGACEEHARGLHGLSEVLGFGLQLIPINDLDQTLVIDAMAEICEEAHEAVKRRNR